MRSPHRPARRGIALIIALVLLALASSLGGLLVRGLLTARQQAENGLRQVQASWLAEAGLSRARARLGADPDYDGETWSIAADELGGRHGAVVTIEVAAPGDQPGARRIAARAEYPAGEAVGRAVESRQEVINAGLEPPGATR